VKEPKDLEKSLEVIARRKERRKQQKRFLKKLKRR
jgi:hypothetical protein